MICAADDEFQDLCFAYGIELDDVVRTCAPTVTAVITFVQILDESSHHLTIDCDMMFTLTCSTMQTSEKEILRKEHQGSDAAAADAEDEVLYKIDIPANRYDMLCLEGIARALNIFNGRQRDVQYRVADMSGRQPLRLTVCASLQMCVHDTSALLLLRPQQSAMKLSQGLDQSRQSGFLRLVSMLQIKAETALVRPFVVAAVLRGVSFDATRYKSFIDLQVPACSLHMTGHSTCLMTCAESNKQKAWPLLCLSRLGSEQDCCASGQSAGEAAPEPVPAAQPSVRRHARPGDAQAAVHLRGAAASCHLLRAAEAGARVPRGRATGREHLT